MQMKKVRLLFVSVAALFLVSPFNVFAEDKDLSADASYKIYDEGNAAWNVDKEFLLKDGERQGEYKKSFAFHTTDAGGYIIIELKKESAISKFLIENRTDGFQERAAGLSIWTSSDQKEWKEVWTAQKVEPSWDIKLEKPVKAKFVKIGNKENNALHLNKVRIYGE